ncbi:aldo/keto reductase [Listeria ivanovii]|uniref:aldo/keto reductase n=1 Tax=Listeria ivanovii TaxID=1638 RepID=UPI000DA96710|nr:aldo/keto reductase [Listeria ivanovii]PZF87781.1 aldo/keto reductase [Listeria ivanovii]PZF92951.1 aldo/keto reductase [Listeria ivanovii]PZG03874.1 aldo/keto reductase [Listeria ivanovii]PZG08265.1 aldo/keto reductase [Listeria ivanovii]PZG25088.1 aldo/keto reductase [Listeria ivanovii]
MEYVKFGNTGMDVSKICLGTMGFGDKDKWVHKWVLDEANSRPIIKKALDLGINFFDTANIYSYGESEKIVGRALKDYASRDDIVLATKVHSTMRPGRPNSSGLSRKAILSEIDQSLKRLETDYVDLYIIHRFDENTPIEETMEAMHDVVKSGKARYIGASAMFAWQFQKAQRVAEKNGWTKFVSMQNYYNLIYREEEREMIPFCRDEKIAITPYSPLASGRLTREFAETTYRSETDAVQKSKYDGTQDSDKGIIERVAELAEKHQVTRDKIALAWMLTKQGITSPIIGAQKESHLESAVAALDIKLSETEVDYLEELYVPHPVVGALPIKK